VIIAALATYLPWLAPQGDRNQVYQRSILPTIPFLYASAGVLLAWTWRWIAARVVAGLAGAAVIGLFAFFLPVLVALPLDADGWRARMWLTDCERPGAPTLVLPDDQISSGPPPTGWCWI
jgi:dolichyl-phosphate-mannose--protein O-mannosyl transferase